jgi:DNA replication protein DnaC
MDKLDSIMRAMAAKSEETGRNHLRIVDADLVAPDDDLPGMVELSGDGVPDTPVPTVPSTLRTARRPRQQPVFERTMLTTLPPAIPAPVTQKEVCPMCKGAGFLRQDVAYGHPEFGKLRKCQCKIKQQAKELFGGAHIPDDFQTCSFESYLCLPLSAEQRQAAMWVQAFVLPRLEATYAGRKRGLYLHGLWGIGKTGLAVSALRQAIDAGKTGLYLPTSDLFDILYESIAASQRLMRGYGDEEDKEEESAGSKLLRLVDSVEWLVLDDLGVECSSRFVISRLYRIIEGRRSRAGFYTIVTSNKDARGLELHWRPERPGAVAFDDCIRIIERIGESFVPVHLEGRSLRAKS